jgi:myo-inositol 2-dehydrogenase / D-chiro-inositol 1-dehydrogenase
VSNTPDRAVSTAARWGGTAHGSVEGLLDEAGPDVVYVCQPPHRAAAVLSVLIERGMPFLTEKPLAASAEDAERIGQQLEQTRSTLVAAVGYHWRGLDVLPLVRDRLAARPARLVLARWTGGTPPPPWWRHVAESGGQVVEQATHLYDLARALVGEANVVGAASARAPRADYPDLDVDDLAAAVLRFDSGAVGSFVSTSILPSSQVELDLLADGARTTIRLGSRDGRMHWTATLDDGAGETVVDVTRDPYEVQAEAFLDAVVEGAADRVLSTYADALRSDRLTRAVVAATGSRG